MTLSLCGLGVSNGIAIGRAHVLVRGELEIPEYAIPDEQVEQEVARFVEALVKAKQQLREVRKHIPRHTAADVAAFIDTHILMLEDSTFSDVPIQLIRTRLCNAERALQSQRDAVVAVFDEMDDPYLRTRRDDVDHVVTRIQRVLLNQKYDPHDGIEEGLGGRIVVADDLTPADTVLIQHKGIMGFITEHGGPTSHTAILARSLHIPAIVGVHHARRYLRDDELIVVDGQQGVTLAGVDQGILEYYGRRSQEAARHQAALGALRQEPTVTVDQRPITLEANIELPEEIPTILRVAAAGVGLYRTEFLFMNRVRPPGEEEQLHAYLRVVHAMKGAPVTIRTLDLGADKQVDGSRPKSPLSTNPALGLRAIRLCLKSPSLFRPQLRAILRASAHGPVRLMLPMLTSLRELFQVLGIIEDTRRELRRQRLKLDEHMPVGGMIEVPAAAVAAHAFAKHLDFLSIGTNDLIQYTLAIDRIDDEVNYLYDPLHPAVLSLIYQVIKAGRRADIPVAMCGEMAGDPRFTRLLLGMGLTHFSTHPTSLLEVKRVITTSDALALVKPVKQILKSTHPEEIDSMLDDLNEQ